MYKQEKEFLKTIEEINDKEKPLLFTKLEVLILLKDYKEQLILPVVVKPFYCFENLVNGKEKCSKVCSECVGIERVQ